MLSRLPIILFLVLVQIHRVSMRLVIGSDAWTRPDWARWNSVQSLVSEGYPAPPLLVADSPESERPLNDVTVLANV